MSRVTNGAACPACELLHGKCVGPLGLRALHADRAAFPLRAATCRDAAFSKGLPGLCSCRR